MGAYGSKELSLGSGFITYDLSDQPWGLISSVQNGSMIPASTSAQGCAAVRTVVRDSNNFTEKRDGPPPQGQLSPRAEREQGMGTGGQNGDQGHVGVEDMTFRSWNDD